MNCLCVSPDDVHLVAGPKSGNMYVWRVWLIWIVNAFHWIIRHRSEVMNLSTYGMSTSWLCEIRVQWNISSLWIWRFLRSCLAILKWGVVKRPRQEAWRDMEESASRRNLTYVVMRMWYDGILRECFHYLLMLPGTVSIGRRLRVKTSSVMLLKCKHWDFRKTSRQWKMWFPFHWCYKYRKSDPLRLFLQHHLSWNLSDLILHLVWNIYLLCTINAQPHRFCHRNVILFMLIAPNSPIFSGF